MNNREIRMQIFKYGLKHHQIEEQMKVEKGTLFSMLAQEMDCIEKIKVMGAINRCKMNRI